jgi:adenine C2-methylase RlmN of 23S rRNA A2503 and tRNA A37
VAPFIRRVGEELGVTLAVGLQAASDELRFLLVPINRKYHRRADAGVPGVFRRRRRAADHLEYVMLKGVNDSPAKPRRWPGWSRAFRQSSTSLRSMSGRAHRSSARPTSR